MALRVEFIVPQDGKTEMTITPRVASEIRWRWSVKEYASKAQAAFIENVMKIHYSPEQSFCLHRYSHQRSVPMRYSKLYIIACKYCDFQYTTDVFPQVLL